MKTRICRNDTVIVLAGRDRGKKGKVLRIFPRQEKILVEGINFRKKAIRKTQENPQGGLMDIEQPVHLSAVGVLCRKCEKAARVGIKDSPERGRLRTCNRCGEVIEVNL